MDKYSVIYAHPSWMYNKHYPKEAEATEAREFNISNGPMPLDEIMTFPVQEVASNDCVLFIWATTPMLPEALKVVEAWGFTYKTLFTWEKTNDGCMGYWFKTCTEHLVIAIKGNVKAFGSPIRNCFHEPQTRRGKKPDYFYRIIEKVTTGKRIQLFARQNRRGWDVWGQTKENPISFELTN